MTMIGLAFTTLATVLVTSEPTNLSTQDRSNNAAAILDGYHENPSISTTGQGALDLTLDDTLEVIEFQLSYDQLEGIAPAVPAGVVTAAHIHLGALGVNGGVVAHLCGGGGKPPCPASGTVTGTIVPGDISGPAVQGLDPGGATTFAEFLKAIRAGFTYVNVHTTRWPTGEIRGQIK